MYGTTRKTERTTKQTFLLKKVAKEFSSTWRAWEKNFLSRIVNNETKEIATSDYNKAELFKKYFVSIVTDPDYSFFIPTKQVEFGNITYIDELEISKDLHRLNVSKSRGADGLPPAFLRETRIDITRSLKILYSNIKRLSKFPTKWKEGIVSPIQKENERVNVKNYCPVTLLSIVSKRFEKILFRSIAPAFLNFVSEFQYGFLPRKSIVLQLITSLSRIYGNLNTAGHVNLLALFDFSKAFDKIKHDIVLKKLTQLGVSEKFFHLLRDYLNGRTQRVKINNSLSDKMSITSGVPQGSILGPLFFLIYINDLPSVVFFSGTTVCGWLEIDI